MFVSLLQVLLQENVYQWNSDISYFHTFNHSWFATLNIELMDIK